MRAMRPSAEWRSFLSNWHGATPDRRAARPVAERRYLRSQSAFPRVPRALRARLGCRGSPPAASHEARCRMAVFSVQLAVYHARPASRGTRRATAVKPRPTCFLSSAHAPYGRGVGCRGSPPAASHEARCRMAVFPVQLAVYHARPASRGTRRATAVKPRPTVMSPYAPARLRRAVRGKGRREEARAQWAQPPQAVSDRQPSTETRIWHGSAKDDD